MTPIDAILSRVSCPKLREPGPDDATLELLFRCAARAPDHGLLRPWRFVVFRGDARAALGDMLAAACLADDPGAGADALDKLRRNPFRAPVVVACVARIVPDHPKVPPVEQVAAVAAAIQNMQLAAGALGLGAMWRTGPQASSAALKQALGFTPRDEIVGFLYLGTPDGERRSPAAEPVAAFVREWSAP